MRQISKQFRDFTATLMGEMSEEDFRLFTEIGISRFRPSRDDATGWAMGYLRCHAFEALLSRRHTKYEEYELGDSHITDLWVWEMDTERLVAGFHRGYRKLPTSLIVEDIVEELASVLFFHIYGPIPNRPFFPRLTGVEVMPLP
jgi:hypothetical protein